MRRIKARFLTQREKVLTPSAMAAFEFAEYQTHEVAGLPDHAGLGDRGADLRHSAHHRRRTEDGDQALRGIDAVLQWNHRRCWTDQRAYRRAGGFDIPKLDAEQHEINCSDGCRIVGRLCRGNEGFATAALDAQAVCAHGPQMGTTSYKCNVGTSFRQGATKRATDPAGTNNCNAHRSNPLSARPTADRLMGLKLSFGKDRVKQSFHPVP